MNFKFFIISILIAVGFVGTTFTNIVFGEDHLVEEYAQEEVIEMRSLGVQLTTNSGTILIELFPEDAPHTVKNFLNLVEDGYYDGVVFHRIIPGFMIQTGDPNTKNPELDRSAWGQGGPGYKIKSEFNTIQHDRGIVSMARQAGPDTAGSQFFIVQKDAPHLDGQYTAFGRVISFMGGGMSTVEKIIALDSDERDAPIDVFPATIIQADVIPIEITNFAGPERNESVIKTVQATASGNIQFYHNEKHDIVFSLPYRWLITQQTSGDYIDVIIEPGKHEHNVQQTIERSGFTPKILVGSEGRTTFELENNRDSTAFFSIAKGDDHQISHNYIFANEDMTKKAHIVMSTQNVPDSVDGSKIHNFKILQLHFNNEETNYSVIYVNLTEYFRYEVNAFVDVVKNFEIMIDGKVQPLNFANSPIFDQIIRDGKEKHDLEALPPARIGGCLIATASYGSELAPQVQLLREIRDNTVLQTQSGTSFMNGFNHFYYSFSPTIADYERENPVFKEAVKLTLTPLLVSLTLLQYTEIDSEHEMLGYGIGLILLNIGMYFVAPAILITKIRSFYKLQ